MVDGKVIQKCAFPGNGSSLAVIAAPCCAPAVSKSGSARDGGAAWPHPDRWVLPILRMTGNDPANTVGSFFLEQCSIPVDHS